MAAIHPVITDTTSLGSCPTCGTPVSGTVTDHEHTGYLEAELRNLTEKYLTVSNQLRELEERHRTRPATGVSTTQHNGDGATASASGESESNQDGCDTTMRSNSESARPVAGLGRFASSFRLPGTGTGKLSASSSVSNSLGTPVSAVEVSDLQKELAKETAAREEAERQASAVTAELEDLSAQLFEQANQMVASERKTNAKLGERVAVLEQRDKDKGKRLERIETALKRIERVRSLLDKG